RRRVLAGQCREADGASARRRARIASHRRMVALAEVCQLTQVRAERVDGERAGELRHGGARRGPGVVWLWVAAPVARRLAVRQAELRRPHGDRPVLHPALDRGQLAARPDRRRLVRRTRRVASWDVRLRAHRGRRRALRRAIVPRSGHWGAAPFRVLSFSRSAPPPPTGGVELQTLFRGADGPFKEWSSPTLFSAYVGSA